MPQWVANKPAGLREDPYLKNGVYVGPRKITLTLECSLSPEEDIIVGECSEEPTQAFIDDVKGEVYIPAGERFLKLGKEDGIKNYFGFWDRLKTWSNTDGGNGWAQFKYVMCGVDCVAPEELGDFFGTYFSDIAHHVMSVLRDENQKEIDWGGHRHLIVKSAAECLSDNEGPSEKACAEPARLALLKLAKHPALSAEDRIDLARIMRLSFPGQTLQLLSKLTTDKQMSPNVRFEAAKLLNVWTPSLENYLNILALAVDEGTPGFLRYESATFVYEHSRWNAMEPVSSMAINALLGLANDSKVEPRVRYQATYYAKVHALDASETRGNEIMVEAIAVILSLAGDKQSPADLRLDAAQAVFGDLDATSKAKNAASQILLDLGRDKSIAPEVRFIAASTLYERDRYNVGEETAILLLSLATDQTLEARNRFSAAKWAYGYESKRDEVRKVLLDFVNDRSNASSLRFDAAHFAWHNFGVGKEENQRREMWKTLVNLANDSKVTPELRLNSALTAQAFALGAAEKEEALKAMEGLIKMGKEASDVCMDAALFVYNKTSDATQKETLMEKMLECGVNGTSFVFFNTSNEEQQRKTTAIITALGEDPFTRIIDDLRNRSWSMPLENKISRAQMVLGGLRWFDWSKRVKVIEALEYFEEQKAQVSPDKKLILKISQ